MGLCIFKMAGGLVEMKISKQNETRGGQEVHIGPFTMQKKETEMKVFNHATMKFLFGLLRAEKDNAYEALDAVEAISPKLVIPCHYSVPFLWNKKFCPADDKKFNKSVEAMGFECRIMDFGDDIHI